MANTTFSGPIRSESTIKTVSKNASSGAITEVITMGDAPVALGDEDKTLDNATHSGRVLAVPALASNRTITLPAPVAGATLNELQVARTMVTNNVSSEPVVIDNSSQPTVINQTNVSSPQTRGNPLPGMGRDMSVSHLRYG